MRSIKILSIVILLLAVITSNVFASNYEEELKTVNEKEYIHRFYSDENIDTDIFISSIEKEFKIDKKTYSFSDIIKTGGNEVETIEIDTSKSIQSDTNDLESILYQLGDEIEYNQDEFIGKYILDVESVNIVEQYNGYKEYKIEENKSYSDLQSNDLHYIPKQITKNGITLDLIKCVWNIDSTRLVGENEIPDKYTAKCYYAGIQRVDNPLTYLVNANYYGIAEKETYIPVDYEVIYEKTKEDINFIPYIIGSSGIVVIIILFFVFRKNVKIYNLKDGHFKFIGRTYISKPKLKLDKYRFKESSNIYRIELSKNAVAKLSNQSLNILRKDKVIRQYVHKSKKPFSFDITM